MSETIPQDAVDPVVADDTVTPVDGAETPETAVETPKPKDGDEGDAAAKRIGRLTARLAAKDAAFRDLESRVLAFEHKNTPAAEPLAPETQRAAEQHAEKLYNQRIVQERADSFHKAGNAAHSDWQERCAVLMENGGDSNFADLLIDMPDGASVAAALADDPDAMERISGLKTERARAIALGKFSAALEAKPAVVRPVSKAPAPIVPLRGGPVKTVFNESTATAAQLVEYYDKQARAARGL
jgi:hypothetical protein